MSRGVICDAVASNPPLAVSFPVFLVSLDSLFLMFLTSQTPTCFFGEAKKMRQFFRYFERKTGLHSSSRVR